VGLASEETRREKCQRPSANRRREALKNMPLIDHNRFSNEINLIEH